MGRLHRARWGPLIGGFLDDELDQTSMRRMLNHLQDCPDCLGELELMARVQQSLARLAPAG